MVIWAYFDPCIGILCEFLTDVPSSASGPPAQWQCHSQSVSESGGETERRSRPFLPFRYSTSLLGEPGSPSIVVLCRCACVWTMSKICVKGVQR